MSAALESREPTPEAPWLGLQPFAENASQYFFGRTKELAALYERVTARPLTLLFGPSGYGKSSLLQAALVPRLRATGFTPVLLRLLHDEGAPNLEQQVFRELGAATQGLGMPAEQAPSLWRLLHDPQYRLCLPGAPRLVLILDQFEEIFTIGQNPSRARQSEAFLSILADLVENRVPEAIRSELEQNEELSDRINYAARPCRFLLSMREDYLHQLERQRAAMPSMMDNRMELRRLNGQQALEATVKPGQIRCQRNPGLQPIISEETGKIIVQFVAAASEEASLDDIDAVPPYFLSLLCEQLNLVRKDEITADLVSARGKDILDEYYRNCIEGRPEGVRRLVEDALVSEAGHRNAMVREEFLAEMQKSNVDEPDRHLGELVDLRMLTVEKGRIELTHDMLTSPIVRSRDARRERETAREAQRQKQEAISKARQERKRWLFWVSALGTLAAVSTALALETYYLGNRAKRLERELRLAAEGQLVAREGQLAAKEEQLADTLGNIESAECTTLRISDCGPPGRITSHEQESCEVPFVSFDPKDEKAYDAVACEFWKQHGIRVKRIACSEEGFRDYRKVLLRQYPGGVFTWAPGQPIAPVVDGVFQLTPKSWSQGTRGTWQPLIRALREGEFGGIYSLPFKFYPWAIYYHKSFIKKNGPFTYLAPPEGNRKEWRVPQTWAELIATAVEMQRRNLQPFAFSFGEGHQWTAMGTFDVLNMRLHGYDAHEKLMRGDLETSDKETHLKELFKHWAELVPYYTKSWATDTVEDSAKALQQGRAGMYLTGSFFLKYVAEKDRVDFGLFDFPKIDTPANATLRDTDVIDAPIDTFVISNSKDENSLACARALLTFLGTDVAAFQAYNAKNSLYLPVNEDALNKMAEPTQEDTPQRQAARLVLRLNAVAGFTDRRVWRLEGRAVAPALSRFLEAAYARGNIEDAISAAVGQIQSIDATD